ncbi:sugar transferase [Solirubrobacter phytolaccae]|uniref:Sugar transferase n=1 Tax=Solirubrobacter phytolaccae TaxID=1404360 RepID=A0A9X3SCP7_9ACTN|nr:sugar transferase [Solirubrobacter phytolaccae]MDA0178952.1 sugar transferase [Solirubrobacter phytolaccae]
MVHPSASTDALTDASIPAEPAPDRRRAVRRQLLSADIIAGSLVGAAVAFASGLTVQELPVVVLAMCLAWPLLAWICGLYALDGTRAGAGDFTRLAVTALVLSWPAYGLLLALDARAPVLGAFAAVAFTGLVSSVGRARTRVERPRAEPTRPPAFSTLERIAKRTLDVVGAGLGLVVLTPVLAVLVVAIRLDSSGPALFTQQRSGRGGRFFRMYRLRAMRVDSTVLVREDGVIVKRSDGDRVTRVGRVLRRFSLDEIPQLVNVLKGDMSLVGPRPLLLAEHAALTEEWRRRRVDLRPGMTGPWQVSGRSQLPFGAMIELDDQYVAGWSLARDLEILLATVPAVLARRRYGGA